jgi:hypothetical protein
MKCHDAADLLLKAECTVGGYLVVVLWALLVMVSNFLLIMTDFSYLTISATKYKARCRLS